MEEPIKEPAFYRAVHRMAEAAWERNVTVQTLLALAELLDGRRSGRDGEAGVPGLSRR